jgi:sulfur-oxidizing protein SoxZ
MAFARIQLPPQAKRGEVIEVRVMIQHPMETGFRNDATGRRVARNAIHSLACRYNGAEVFRATMSTGIAANPLLRFFTHAVDSGELEFWWLDDENVEGTARARLVVS